MRKIILIVVLIGMRYFSVFAERFDLESYAGSLNDVPIAITKFISTTLVTKNSPDVIIADDLSFTGRFKVYKTTVSECKSLTSEGVGLSIGGQYTIAGNTISLNCTVKDLATDVILLGRKYEGNIKNLRAMAHRFSNFIYNELLGEKGPFESKILFVEDKVGTKSLMIMDYDGKGIKKITSKGVVNIFPAFADASTVIWTSFRRGKPDLYKGSIKNGISKIFIYSRSIETSPAVSNVIGKLAYSSSKAGNLDIYTANLDGTDKKQITLKRGIDTSPCWSPNGYLIAFTSDRSGQPQIYVMDSDGMNVKRLTFDGKYQDSPAWSPKGDKIAYSSYREGKFDIWTMDTDGKNQKRITTFSGNNEYPAWSPDGSNISFTSRSGSESNIFIIKSDGTDLKQVTKSGHAKMADWSKF